MYHFVAHPSTVRPSQTATALTTVLLPASARVITSGTLHTAPSTALTSLTQVVIWEIYVCVKEGSVGTVLGVL